MARFNNGWIKIYRSAGDSDLAQNPILLALWFKLLTWATWKPSKIIWQGKQREIPPGSVVFGLNLISKRWKCSPATISRWLRYLQSTDRITLETGTRGSLATIRNWELYQSNEDDERTPPEHEVNVKRTPSEREVILSKEEKKGRKKKEEKREIPRLAEIWNQNRGSLPEVRGCSSTRRKSAEARWEEHPDPEYWTAIVERIARSSFCQGENDRGWRADFDFLIQPETQHKALEGKYDDRGRLRALPPMEDPYVVEMERIAKDAMEGRR